MRRLSFASFVLALFLSLLLLVPLAAAQNNGQAVVKVMTYNINEGTDFLEVTSATTLPDFLAAVQTTLNNIDSTNPPLRMQAVAKQIAQNQPDLVGLQEVTTWTLNGVARYDMLQELLDALHNLGEDYVPVVVVQEFAIAGPLPDLATVVGGVNHDVILRRAASEMELSNIQQSHYSIVGSVPLPFPPGHLDIPRGWGSVDVTLHGHSFRFIVSHLDPFDPANPITLLLQEAEAAELAQGPAATTLPVVIAIDANADALGGDASIATYELIRSFGFGDAWAAVHPNEPGATWGFMPDPNDLRPSVHQRIDFIFFSSDFRALTAQLAGQRVQDQVDGLWPSDHAGVRASLLLQQP